MRPSEAKTASDFSTARGFGGLSCACSLARKAFLPSTVNRTLCLKRSPRSFATNASMRGATCLSGRIALRPAVEAEGDGDGDGDGPLPDEPPVQAAVSP